MKLTRRDFLSFAATASLAALLPMPALADEMTSDEILSAETLEDGTLVIETTRGTWTIKVEEVGSLRTCTISGPSGEMGYFVYDRATGDLYSSITGKTVSIGADESYRPRPETRGVIDHDPPVLRNGKTTYRDVPMSYYSIRQQVGGIVNVATVIAALAALGGANVGNIKDILTVVRGALAHIPGGDRNHGIMVRYKETERLREVIGTGNWVYYDTVRTAVSAWLY